jgi:hypothetical protein
MSGEGIAIPSDQVDILLRCLDTALKGAALDPWEREELRRVLAGIVAQHGGLRQRVLHELLELPTPAAR